MRLTAAMHGGAFFPGHQIGQRRLCTDSGVFALQIKSLDLFHADIRKHRWRWCWSKPMAETPLWWHSKSLFELFSELWTGCWQMEHPLKQEKTDLDFNSPSTFLKIRSQGVTSSSSAIVEHAVKTLVENEYFWTLNFVSPNLISLPHLIPAYKPLRTRHVQHLQWVMGEIQSARLTLNIDKCECSRQEVCYLGNRQGSGEVDKVFSLILKPKGRCDCSCVWLSGAAPVTTKDQKKSPGLKWEGILDPHSTTSHAAPRSQT